MKLTMVGTGYVGLVTGACLASIGNEVTCLDIDAGKIEALNRGACPIYEPGLADLLKRGRQGGRLLFTTDKDQAYRDAEGIFICVGTPSDADGAADMQYVLAVAEDIAEALKRAPADRQAPLIVVKSTVPVGTTHKVGKLIRERSGRDLLLANNPEFLKEGAAVNDFMKPDRVVVGVDDERSAELMREIYEPFVRQGNPIIVVDVRSSEMVKYASNAFLACKISFINEISQLCEALGADVQAVRQGMSADQRIGKHFLYAGLGYGGSCFPKDTLAVVRMGHVMKTPCLLNEAVHQVNQQQRERFWKKIEDHFAGKLNGRTLAFWGVSFKPETDDIREAPSIYLMQKAIQAGAQVHAFDPEALKNLEHAVPQARPFSNMYEMLDGADALVICTEWNEFRFPRFEEIAERLKQKVVFDGRNIFRRSTMAELGFTYYPIGRPPVNAGTTDGK